MHTITSHVQFRFVITGVFGLSDPSSYYGITHIWCSLSLCEVRNTKEGEEVDSGVECEECECEVAEVGFLCQAAFSKKAAGRTVLLEDLF